MYAQIHNDNNDNDDDDIGGHVLCEVDKGKYLGVTVSNDLSWSSHVAEVCKKSNNTLSFSETKAEVMPRTS